MPLVALYRLISHFVRNARFAERFTRKHVNARGFDFCFRKAYTVPVDDRFHVFVRAAFTYNRALPRSRVQGRGSVFRLSKLIEIRIGEKVRGAEYFASRPFSESVGSSAKKRERIRDIRSVGNICRSRILVQVNFIFLSSSDCDISFFGVS